MNLISSGIKELDKIIEGYPDDGITTFFGAAGSGKTNLILTAAIKTAETGKKIIIINTEGEIISERLKQLLTNEQLLKSFIFFTAKTFAEQEKIIHKINEFSLKNIGLIAFDSSNKLLRVEKNQENKEKFKQQLAKLKKTAREKKIPILLTAQVYQSYETDENVIFAGPIINEFSDCVLELIVMNQIRKLTLKKHNTTIGEKIFLFKIEEKEIKSFIENCTKD